MVVSSSFLISRLYPLTSALRMAVSFRFACCSGMGSPSKHRSLQKGIWIPWRLLYQNPLVVFSHVSFQKVRVMLLIDSEKRLGKTPYQDSSFWMECLCLVSSQNHKGIKIFSANRSLFNPARPLVTISSMEFGQSGKTCAIHHRFIRSFKSCDFSNGSVDTNSKNSCDIWFKSQL